MTVVALLLAISLGMQLTALACPGGARYFRTTAIKIILGCLAIACFFVWGGPLLALRSYPELVLAELSYVALISAWPANNQWRLRNFFDLVMSLPLGIGAISWVWFVWLWLGGRTAAVPFVMVVCAVSMAASVLLMTVRHRKKTPTTQEISCESERHYLIEIACCFGSICSLVHIIWKLISEPLGQWDAWMLWNARAHFLFRSGADWMQQFSAHDTFRWLHPDYPLLLPAAVSAIWQLRGQESVNAPMIISGLFTVSVIAILTFGVALLRTRNQGYLAGLAIMSVPVLYLWGPSQQADVPVSVYILGALVCFSLHEITNENGLLYLSGSFAGMAAWTKNEGGLFALLFFCFALLGLRASGQTKLSRIRNLTFFVFGLLPWALILVLFKILLAPTTETLQHPLPELWAKLSAPQQYLQLSRSFIEEFGKFGLPFLIFYALLFGLRFRRSKLMPLFVIAATAVGLFVGDLFGCLLLDPTPEHLVRLTQDRLLLQMWPSLLLLFFSVVQTPEDLYRRFSLRSLEKESADT